MKKLEAQEISKTYRGRRVVDDVSLVVWQGEVVGLLGPAGAGKTTVLGILKGKVRPDSGHVVQDDPAFLVMDDVFDGLDQEKFLAQQQRIRRLAQEGFGVLISGHSVRDIGTVADRLYIMNNGRIFRSGSPAAMGFTA